MNAEERACSGDSCVTCSDEAVQVRVLRLLDDEFAAVATETGEEVVSIALVPAGPGDVVLVHAGESIAIVEG
ncbi:hydrogenase assembly protein HupF [Saccharopolyspora sp. WRP15-2]|uniref:Hydrogenase assembly protein HupF n=1 Tax=Saccharopolyspora oryzae TaxID=2997343 RepID=A0ABT4UVS3_9PSEU|nr:hydrogenase assembly protein HupF [Saccharopolyspora oryzae]MDA3625209.1 hydrogenase assembly protein HupF [Saccharopolyspora oryzae]